MCFSYKIKIANKCAYRIVVRLIIILWILLLQIVKTLQTKVPGKVVFTLSSLKKPSSHSSSTVRLTHMATAGQCYRGYAAYVLLL